MDVDEDPRPGQQVVLVAAEHETGHATVDRLGEPEQAQLGAPVPQQRSERRQHGSTPTRVAAEEQHVDVTLDGLGDHGRHAAERQPVGLDAEAPQRVDAVGVDVEHERQPGGRS